MSINVLERIWNAIKKPPSKILFYRGPSLGGTWTWGIIKRVYDNENQMALVEIRPADRQMDFVRIKKPRTSKNYHKINHGLNRHSVTGEGLQTYSGNKNVKKCEQLGWLIHHR